MSLEALHSEISELKNLIQNLGGLQSEYLNVEQASAYLGISKSTLYKLTSSNSLTFYKPNGKVLLFKREDLNHFIEKGRVDSREDYLSVANKMIEKLNL